MVERIRAAGVLGERALEIAERAVEVAAGGEEQAAPRCRIASAQARSSAAARGPPDREDLVGLVELVHRDQRLEQVAQLESLRRLEHEVVADLVRPAQMGGPRSGLPSESSMKPSTQP